MKNKKKYLKEDRGITLIALVITIIVLLILAGVSIAMLTGDNGILTQAQKAKTETVNAQEDELRRLTALEAATNLENTTYEDKSGQTAPIPVGFAVSQVEGENTIEDGLVIIDKNGNEFVWVPVKDINDMAQCSIAGGNCNLKLENNQLVCKTEGHNNNIEIVGKLYATSTGENFGEVNTSYSQDSGLREPAILSRFDNNTTDYNTIGLKLEDLKNEYREMAKSVAKYKGFYVGRYETSLNDATTTSSGTSGNVQSKQGVMPVTTSNSATSTWYGLYDKSKKYTTEEYNSVQSSMIWGSQYDVILNWALTGKDKQKVTEVGIGNNDSEGITVCGDEKYVEDNINNIRDLGGNINEITLEAYSDSNRVIRGGRFNKSRSPSIRGGNLPYVESDYVGSRLTLYIK